MVGAGLIADTAPGVHAVACRYGTTQVQSAEDVRFENLDGTGGVTLRLETGIVNPGAIVTNIEARNIVCRDGHAAVMMEPHTQKNGLVTVHNATSFGCSTAA